jgi:hypothetical protein
MAGATGSKSEEELRPRRSELMEEGEPEEGCRTDRKKASVGGADIEYLQTATSRRRWRVLV